MKYVELCARTFEVHTSKAHPVAPITGYDYDEIFDVYGRPSSYKVAIWHEWCEWCEDMNRNGFDCGIQIDGHNCNFFTISGSIRQGDDVVDIWITAQHNRLYKHS